MTGNIKKKLKKFQEVSKKKKKERKISNKTVNSI